MYGIELDDFSPNAGNGTIDNISYFKTRVGHGYFARWEDIYETTAKIGQSIPYPLIGHVVTTFEGIGTIRYKVIVLIRLSLQYFFLT